MVFVSCAVPAVMPRAPPTSTAGAIGAVSVLVSVALQGCGSLFSADRMTCGEGVPLCGVLVLQSGLGRGEYRHASPTVHGLWPQTGRHGTSQCRAPRRSVPVGADVVHSCYERRDEPTHRIVSFQRHEWQKHGMCAGVDGESDYFVQVCNMSAAPLNIMKATRFAGGGVLAMSAALASAGFPVRAVHAGEHDELHLSACAGRSGRWQFADPADFQRLCKDDGVREAAVDSSLQSASCPEDAHGPPCRRDGDCRGFSDCVRCAASGFCTRTPLVAASLQPARRRSASVNSTADALSVEETSCVTGRRGPSCKDDGDCFGKPGCLRCALSGFCTDVARLRSHAATLQSGR